MIKRIVGCMLLLASIVFLSFDLAMAEENEILTITGDGVVNPMTFSRSELESMQSEMIDSLYSSKNNWPSNKKLAARGVSLKAILEKAGVKSEAKMITVKAFDGYKQVFTCKELLQDERYYFPKLDQDSEVGAQIVETMIALKQGNTLSDMEDEYMKLCLGQRTMQEQTFPSFVKYVDEIEVSTVEPQKWAVPQTKESEGIVARGTEIVLEHPNFNKVKIHYTVDGTQPTINSPMYNISTTYYQPELNKPIIINEDTTIKAVAIGAGEMDSDIITFSYKVGVQNQIQGKFSDLQGFEWAQKAIEDLADKGIINGMGNGRFAPEGILTRAQFAKIMVGALYGEPDIIENSRFSDIAGNAWYGKYVEKAAQEGLINGFDDGRFGPDQSLTNEQMIAIVIRAMGKNDAASKLNGAGLSENINIDTVSNWAKGYVELAEQEGLLEIQHLDGPLIANVAATRAESAEIVYRMLGKR